MTIREKKDIPERTGAGNDGESDQPLSDTALEQLTGGATDMDDWPPCTTQDELDTEELAMLEGKSSMDAGTNKILIEK
jgi:hypothetical protein